MYGQNIFDDIFGLPFQFELLLRIILSCFAGAIIGYERKKKEKGRSRHERTDHGDPVREPGRGQSADEFAVGSRPYQGPAGRQTRLVLPGQGRAFQGHALHRRHREREDQRDPERRPAAEGGHGGEGRHAHLRHEGGLSFALLSGR